MYPVADSWTHSVSTRPAERSRVSFTEHAAAVEPVGLAHAVTLPRR